MLRPQDIIQTYFMCWIATVKVLFRATALLLSSRGAAVLEIQDQVHSVNTIQNQFKENAGDQT